MATTTKGEPRFRVLERDECEGILARNSVGRIAFVRGGRIEIVPLHYVFAEGILCARTAEHTRLEGTSGFSDAWPVAFEVDEVEGLFRWRSVVVHGTLHATGHRDAAWQRDTPEWREVIRLYRTLLPDAFSDADPARFRNVLIRIDLDQVSGREASEG